MFDDHSPFPYLSTRRIILRPDSVRVEGLLSTEENTMEPYWFRSGEFADYVRFYFVLYRNTKIEDFAKFQDEQTRVRHAMSEIVPPELLEQEMVNLQLVQGFDWTRYFASKMVTNPSMISFKTITLSQIIDQHSNFIINLSMSDMSREQINDIYFEVDVPLMINDNVKSTTPRMWGATDSGVSIMEAGSFETLLDANFIKDLKLMCFSHLDVRSLVENYNLSAQSDAIANLFTVGGNMTYDRLIEPTVTGRRIPRTRSVFYVSGQPRIDENGNPVDEIPDDPFPAPGTLYVGEKQYGDWGDQTGPHWRAVQRTTTFVRPGDQRITKGPRLEKRELPQTKVLGTFPISPASISTGYVGFELPPPGRDGALNPLGNIDMDITENLPNTFRAMFDFDPTVQPHDVDLAILEMIKERQREVADYLLNEETWIDSRISAHSTIFTLDVLNLIARNSNYGYLLRLHSDNQELMKKILSRSNIRNLSVNRNRLSNYPTGNNELYTPRYLVENRHTPQEHLVSSRDERSSNFKNKFISNVSDTNKLEELNIDYGFMFFGRNRDYYRSFAIRDTSLYQEISTGRYSYDIEIEIEDGIKQYFMTQYRHFKKALCNLQKFLHIARIPYRPNNYYYGPNALYTNEEAVFIEPKGNYDYKLDEFTDTFIASHGHADKLKDFINIYSDLAHLTHKVEIPKNEYLRFILPEAGATLETAELLLDHSQKYDKYLLEMMNADKKRNEKPQHEYGKKQNFLSHTGARSSAQASLETSQFIVREKLVLSSVVESFQENEVMLDYGLSDQLGSYAGSIGSSQALDAGNSSAKMRSIFDKVYMPNSYFYNRDQRRVDIVNKSAAELKSSAKRSKQLKLKKNCIARSTNKNYKSANAGLAVNYMEDNFYNITSLPFCIPGFSFVLNSEKGTRSNLLYGDFIKRLKKDKDSESVFSSLTTEMQTVLCESAYKKVEREKFLDNFLETYKSMVNIKEGLGETYDNIFKIINAVEDLSYSYGLEHYRDKLNDKKTRKKGPRNTSPGQDLFANKSLPIESVGDSGMAYRTTGKRKALKIFKLRPVENKNSQENIRITNNVALIEV